MKLHHARESTTWTKDKKVTETITKHKKTFGWKNLICKSYNKISSRRSGSEGDAEFLSIRVTKHEIHRSAYVYFFLSKCLVF